MDISIIIVNYRAWKALDKCLISLKEAIPEQLDFEVIVVDNDPEDDNFGKFSQKYPHFRFVRNGGNYGFSNGCNLGASYAQGKYLFFLNPDTRIFPGVLEKLLQTSLSYPKIGILTCLQINERKEYYKLKNQFPSFWRFFGLQRAVYRQLKKGKLAQKFEVKNGLFFPDWVTGAAIFMSREWFGRINGWNEDYWLYFEDVDLCKKICQAGGKVAVETGATIFHEHGGASRININTKSITKTEVIISKHVYIHYHFPSIQKVILHMLLIFGSLIEKTLLSVLSLVIPKLKVNFLILKKLFRYYFNALKKKTWISPRARNYPASTN